MDIRATRIYHGEWIAVDDDTYDGAEDSPNQCGVGSTEQEAIEDLMEKLAPQPIQVQGGWADHDGNVWPTQADARR